MNRIAIVAIVWFVVSAGGCVPGNAFAQSPSDDQSELAIEAGRTQLKRVARFPWYDENTDQPRPVEVRVEPPPPEVKNWVAPTSNRTRGPRKRWNTTLVDILSRCLQVIVWLFLAVIFLVGIYFGVRAASDSDLRMSDSERIDSDRRTDADRIENLPIDIKRTDGDFLSEAERAYNEHNYQKAIIYLFSYQLVQLDKHHWVRLAKGKTNRQYLKELRRQRKRPSRSDLHALCENTVIAFEDAFFGHHEIDRQRFESCWNRLDQFHQWLDDPGAQR